MKNDKEWLKGLINEEGIVVDMHLLGRLDSQYWKNENIKVNKGRLFYLIDQLDEPETLSQEWIDENKVARINDVRKMTTSDVVPVEKLENLLVPKQDKPVIPQFVAEFIETYKKRDGSLGELLGHIEWSKKGDGEVLLKVVDWVYPDNYSGVDTDGINIIARAWLDGYEVEEEQKYRVIDRHKVCLLAKEEERNKVETVAKLVEIYGHDHVELNYQLTEQEIKDYDERYWEFAQEETKCN